MRTAAAPRARPRRAGLAAAVLIALASGACVERLAADMACVLGGVDGDLVRAGDGLVLVNAGWNGRHWDRLRLVLPPGWTVRPAARSELELIDAQGSVYARTGTHAFIGAATEDLNPPEPLVRDGALLVCPSG